MRFLLLLPALLLALTATACDTTTPPEEEEEEEVAGPIEITYTISAPPTISDYAIRYTNADGEPVLVPAGDRVTFPYSPPSFQVEADAQGTFAASIEGFASSGAVQVQIQAKQDGLIVETVTDTDQATGPNDAVSASAALDLPLPAAAN